MRRPWDQWRTYLLWLSIPVYLAVLVRNWASIPDRLAVHFSASGAVNGTLPRDGFIASSTLLLVVEALIFSVAARKRGPDTRISRIARYAFRYGFTGFITAILIRLVRYNLHGGAISSVAVVVGLTCAALGVVVAFTIPGKPRVLKPPADGSDIVGESTHRSTLQSTILCSIVVVFAAMWIALAFMPFRIVMGCVLLVMGYLATITTLGFRYLVSPTALQINWGFRRMEVVPASAIDSVTIEPIHPARDFGGWGARWSGEDRAYILKGKTAVKIATPCGNIFLGSNSPEDLLKLVRRMNIAHA
ncbi:MAG TPA: hypothetical protein VN709_04955 [Terriglobales bacterium]|nr:hypothetical protein [Terriglobales bacterium]